MARRAEALRALAYDLYADEPLVQERRFGSRVREDAGRADRPHKDRSVRSRLDLDQGASGWDRRSKKTGLRPSASRAADGTPRFIWLPRMLERR